MLVLALGQFLASCHPPSLTTFSHSADLPQMAALARLVLPQEALAAAVGAQNLQLLLLSLGQVVLEVWQQHQHQEEVGGEHYCPRPQEEEEVVRYLFQR